MKITAHEEYGLRIILRLAQIQSCSEGLVSLNEIAKQEGISVENTAAILSKLRDADLVESIRGKYGGYKLKKSPEEINLFQVVNGISKDTFDVYFCETHTGKQEVCVHANECSIKSVWQSVNSMINNFLASISLKQLMLKEKDFHKELENSFTLKEVLGNV